MPRNRAGIDDFAHAPAALLFHLLGRRLRAENHAFDVDVEHAVDIGLAHIFQRHHVFNAGIVDKHIHTAEGVCRVFDQRKLIFALAHIAQKCAYRRAARLEFGFGCGQRVGIDVRQHNGKAVLRQTLGNAFAQAIARAGDHCYFFAAHCIAPFEVESVGCCMLQLIKT